MTELADYEQRGDLDAPFVLTAQHTRAQRQSERIRDALDCDVPALTFEDYRAGQPCPGCGLPYVDEESWESKGLMYLTPTERVRYDAEEARYLAVHGECGSHRHSVHGSLTLHCGKCCPAPPLSPSQIASIARILSRPRTPPHDLMRWQLRWYCGHVTEKTAHYTHKTLHSAFTGSTSCPDCGLDPATIIDGRAIGLAGEPPSARGVREPRKPTRAQLEAKVLELEAEVERLRPSPPPGFE